MYLQNNLITQRILYNQYSNRKALMLPLNQYVQVVHASILALILYLIYSIVYVPLNVAKILLLFFIYCKITNKILLLIITLSILLFKNPYA